MRAVIIAALLCGAAVRTAPGWTLEAPAARRTACVISFNSFDEIQAFRSSLSPDEFEFLDLAPQGPLPAETAEPTGDQPPPWIFDRCRPDIRCDVAIYSAEFAGRFFGKNGFSLSLQEMEEASCQARCDGLFHDPQEVFLLACNTLATKDQDGRTPEEYLRILLDHGFDRASAEQVVELRYGPLGPSFREALRRIFAGVPQIYGFSSVAPKAVVTAPMLARYLAAKGDYTQHLEQAAGRSDRNVDLLRAFKDTALTQTTGLKRSEPGAQDRDAVCALYDEGRRVPDRLRIAHAMMSRDDFLAFVPTLEVFLARHPPDRFDGESRALFEEITTLDAARERILRLVTDLNVSALKLQLAHFALEMDWITGEELRRIAVDGTKKLLFRPLTSEAVDIICEIAKRQNLGDDFQSPDLSTGLFEVSEGVRLLDCLRPADERVNPRLADALDGADPSLRLWAGYALSRRLPLDDSTLTRLAGYLNDGLPDLRARVRWTFVAQGPLSNEASEAVHAQDPVLAEELGRRYRSAARRR
ncbi:MAG: hypothetical protein E6J56_03665 [Deltaproteobacteria bacterium]|nr:MAG: hypothetical protein E6J56_03665 [Deltaproteobacteria bacterium]